MRLHSLPVRRQRVCVVGPLLGGNEGWVLSQGEILAKLLAGDGHDVLTVSSIPSRWRRLVDTLWSLIRWRNRYDVVIFMVFSGPAFWICRLVVPILQLLNKDIVLWLHGGNLPSFLAAHPRSRAWLGRSGHQLVAPSRYLLNALPYATSPITTIPNVLPQGPFGFRLRRDLRPKILWMRTFHPLYRPLLAVETVQELKRRGVDAHLTLAGQDKGMLDSVRAAIDATSLGHDIELTGFLEPAAKEGAFASNDIFLNTTEVDNAPVSLLEAASAGMVIVSSSVGGIPFLFSDGVDALLVESASPASFADAIQRLLDGPQLAATISQGARALADELAWDKVRPQWEKLFEELGEAAANGPRLRNLRWPDDDLA